MDTTTRFRCSVIVPPGVLGGVHEESLSSQFSMLASDMGYELGMIRAAGDRQEDDGVAAEVDGACSFLWSPDEDDGAWLEPQDIAIWGGVLVYRGRLSTEGLVRRYSRRYAERIQGWTALVSQMAMSIADGVASPWPADSLAGAEVIYWGTRRGIPLETCQIIADEVWSCGLDGSLEGEYLFDIAGGGYDGKMWNALLVWQAAYAEAMAGGDGEVRCEEASSWGEATRSAGDALGVFSMMDACESGVPAADVIGAVLAARLR